MKVKFQKITEFLSLREYINKNKITSISPGSYSQSNCYHVDFLLKVFFFHKLNFQKMYLKEVIFLYYYLKTKTLEY
jgi:hypothetical protein